MMKICFLPPTTEWAIEGGFHRRWENFLCSVPHSGLEYSIVSEQSLADFVITSCTEATVNGNLINLLRPLKHKDIQTFTWDVTDYPTGRFSGFYCSLPKGLFDRRRHTSMSYPGPFNELIQDFPRQDATLDFSFLGQLSAGVRVRLLEQFCHREREINAVVRDSGRTVWTGGGDVRASNEVAVAKLEYADLLLQSKFVLCPRGGGAGSFRLFETMQAGRVPVIISDAYVKPDGIDWTTCSLTIPESRIADIPAIIRSRLDDWEDLAANARSVWEANFSPQHVMDTIATNLARMSGAISQEAFSPWCHSARVGAAVLQEHVRPVAGRAKARLKKMKIM